MIHHHHARTSPAGRIGATASLIAMLTTVMLPAAALPQQPQEQQQQQQQETEETGLRATAVRMGADGLVAPKKLEAPLPEYTPSAKRAGIEGDVYIEAVVDTEGNVVEPKLIRGLPDEGLNQAALDSIVQWRFEPGTKDDVPVPVLALFTVTFRIE